MKRPLILILAMILSIALSCPELADAQTLAVKSNLLSDATATAHLGIEAGLDTKLTFDLSGSYNPWNLPDFRRQKQWMVQPELRWWFCEAFNGHFLALHALGGEFNMANPCFPFSLDSRLEDYRYEGWMWGAGIGYGYQWILSPHWSLEAEIGAGYIGTDYDKFECVRCGELLEQGVTHSFGITKLAISIIYVLF